MPCTYWYGWFKRSELKNFISESLIKTRNLSSFRWDKFIIAKKHLTEVRRLLK